MPDVIRGFIEDGVVKKYDYNYLANLPFVTPEMCGAKGDGETDDTEAWQTALDNGRVIFCNPSSNYYITAALRVRSDTTIFMNDCTVTCSQKRWLFNFLDTDEFTQYNGNGNIRVVNGIVYGGSVSFWHGEHISFERMKFKDCLNDHFFELAASKDFTIEKCSFIGMKETAGSVHEYINIDPNGTSVSTYFTGSSYRPANYDNTRNEDVYIRDNFFDINENDENFQAHDNPFGCHTPIGNYHKNIQFVGNTCLNFKVCAVRLSDFEEALIQRNYFRSELCNNFAIQMTASNGMAYSNINCIVEDNTFNVLKWCVLFEKSKGLTVRRNSYENLDYENHGFGTLGAGNEQLSYYNNVKAKNSSPTGLVFDEGDYTGVEVSPFDYLQRSFVSQDALSVSENTITLNKLRWTFFDRIYLQFTNSPKIFRVDAWPGYQFVAENNYPVIQDPTTGQALVHVRIDGTNQNELNVVFATGVTTLTVQAVYVEKTIGTKPA